MLTGSGRLLFNMLGAIAQFETEIRAERQADGIQKAKERGVRYHQTPVFYRSGDTSWISPEFSTLQNLTYLQQQQRYQVLGNFPVCKNNRNRHNLALIPVPVVPWVYPNSIGIIAVLSDSCTCLNSSIVREQASHGKCIFVEIAILLSNL
jgi:hypothetical protein